MRNLWRERAIALAGLTQAVAMVDQLAKTGYLEVKSFETCVLSLFQLDPPHTQAVFGDLSQLEKGLSQLNQLLENQRIGERGNQLLGYSLGVLHLQNRLQRNKQMLGEISRRLTQARNQLDHFGPTHDNLVANLADIYTSTLSTFRFRIQVVGEYQYLQQTRVANQVRVLLFAAVRAAMLWRQLGGSRWHLLLYRKRLLAETESLLREARAGV